jgi:hypothetical protein
MDGASGAPARHPLVSCQHSTAHHSARHLLVSRALTRILLLTPLLQVVLLGIDMRSQRTKTRIMPQVIQVFVRLSVEPCTVNGACGVGLGSDGSTATWSALLPGRTNCPCRHRPHMTSWSALWRRCLQAHSTWWSSQASPSSSQGQEQHLHAALHADGGSRAYLAS